MFKISNRFKDDGSPPSIPPALSHLNGSATMEFAGIWIFFFPVTNTFVTYFRSF